jgi:hypothetical protein
MTERPTLDEPVTVAKFFKNRRHDVVAVTLSTFNGRNVVDVRQFFQNQQGQDRPTAKGVAMDVRKLPDLAKAINKAVERARELGLIDESEKAEA